MPNVFSIFTPNVCLDEEFDAPDLAADHSLCCAIAAGRWGLHPDAWGNHDPLPLRWLLRRRREPEPYEPILPFDPDWVAKWSRPLVEEKPPPKPPPKPPRFVWRFESVRERLGLPPGELWPDPARWVPRRFGANIHGGELKLTCDDCGAAFPTTRSYGPGERDATTAAIRRMGKPSGWTCIVGRDRCPRCSQTAAPEAVGHGAGARQRHKQHA